jgi:methylaspartate mutase S subunit
MSKMPTIITGTIGMDAHVIGTKVVSRALKDAGYNVVELGMQVSVEEFIHVAQETRADGIMMSSLYGMAEFDLKDFKVKLQEAGLNNLLLYIGGNLMVGKHDPKEVEEKFKKLGFDRVYPPGTNIKTVIATDLKNDLEAKSLLKAK